MGVVDDENSEDDDEVSSKVLREIEDCSDDEMEEYAGEGSGIK